MADIHHTPKMTSMDNVTVVLYRLGLGIATLTLLFKAIGFFVESVELGNWFIPLLAGGTALSAANIHLYDHRFRYLITSITWLALITLVFASFLHFSSPETLHFVSYFGIGLLYAALGMYALKEDYCFKIQGLKLVPVFLAASVFLGFLNLKAFEIYVSIPAILYLIVLNVAKWRMPLHFDVGDKSKYTH